MVPQQCSSLSLQIRTQVAPIVFRCNLYPYAINRQQFFCVAEMTKRGMQSQNGFEFDGLFFDVASFRNAGVASDILLSATSCCAFINARSSDIVLATIVVVGDFAPDLVDKESPDKDGI